MNVQLDIERKLDMEREKLPKSSPYELIIRQLQSRLANSTDRSERLELETNIVFLLGIHQLTKGVDRIARALEKLNRTTS